ncbi:TssQ family T6SS-associated lipoprotein [Massilia forsythiae]|nr:TssQ family T6SS-associated lipoprotein [Massilia forsythiae]
MHQTSQHPATTGQRGRTRTVPPRAAGLLCALLAATVLAACSGDPILDTRRARTPSHPKAADVLKRQAAPARERSDAMAGNAASEAGLREGIRLYGDGDFNGAIRRLAARDVAGGPQATRLEALKYTAFSYCVSARAAQCRQAFDRALRLDPSFTLDPGEQGHPLWGPVFDKARQAAPHP